MSPEHPAGHATALRPGADAAVGEHDVRPADVPASWRAWFAGADLADEPDLALALLTSRPTAGEGPDARRAAAHDEARLHLLAGRPAPALVALARTGSTVLPAAPADRPATALLAACRAAAGDAQAYRWLLAGLHGGEWASGWQAAYVVGAAAEARGDTATADEMWTRVVADHGIRTRHTLPRAAVARAADRDRTDPAAGAAAVVEAAALLESAPDGHRSLLAAADALEARGDAAGAVLLLAAALRRGAPPTAGVRAELARRLAALGGRCGLDRATRRAWRVLHTRTHEVVGGSAVPVGRELRTLDVAVGVAALLPAVAVGAVWAAVVAGLVLAAHVGLRAVHARAALRREETATRRAAARAAAGCHCFETPVLTGGPTGRVGSGHLVPVDDVPLTAALAGLGAGAALACCPSTGYLWLRPDPAGDLLLRGRPVGAEPDDDAVPPGEGPTGFYL